MNKKKRKNKHSKNSIFSVLFNEYRFELTVGLLFSLGVFLLWEDMEIKNFVWNAIETSARFAADIILLFLSGVAKIIRSVETSDVIGLIFIISAGVLVLDRVRIRTIERMILPDTCPKCDGDLQRIHRTLKHRILEIIMTARIKHYRCKNCSHQFIAAKRKKKTRITE